MISAAGQNLCNNFGVGEDPFTRHLSHFSDRVLSRSTADPIQIPTGTFSKTKMRDWGFSDSRVGLFKTLVKWGMRPSSLGLSCAAGQPPLAGFPRPGLGCEDFPKLGLDGGLRFPRFGRIESPRNPNF